MSITELFTSARDALHLILSFPGHWLMFIAAFVVIAEVLMFIPYVGFTLKMAVVSLIGAHSFVLFHEAASDLTPDLTAMFGAFSLPPMAQASIVLSGLIPFLIGVFYLQVTGGWSATKFFFGNILKDKPPEAKHFEHFKYVMQLSAIPFTFVTPLVVLGGIHDSTALSRGVLLGLHHWPVLLLLLGTSLLSEWANARTTGIPMKFAIPLLSVSLIAFIAWMFAFSYTLYVAIGSIAR
jgi:hypothetical protein